MQVPSMQLYSSSCTSPRWGSALKGNSAVALEHNASSLSASLWRYLNSCMTHSVDLLRMWGPLHPAMHGTWCRQLVQQPLQKSCLQLLEAVAQHSWLVLSTRPGSSSAACKAPTRYLVLLGQ